MEAKEIKKIVEDAVEGST